VKVNIKLRDVDTKISVFTFAHEIEGFAIRRINDGDPEQQGELVYEIAMEAFHELYEFVVEYI
jgi:hypothetical protein